MEQNGAVNEQEDEQKLRRLTLRGWIIVCAIAVLFIAYGFLAFFVIGDKGPPNWDYGSMKEVPAESVYSTYPYREHAGAPEAQHVDQRPADATMGMGEQQKAPAANKGAREGRR